MSFCPHCDTEYTDSASFCPDCQKMLVPDDASEDISLTCTNCNTLNSSDAKFCWECGGYLQAVSLNTIPVFLKGDVIQCCNCENETPLGFEYCIQCGYILSAAQACINHNENRTRFLCLICKKPVCRKCARKVNNKYLCRECGDYHVVGNWVVVFATDSEQELSVAQQILEEAGIFSLTGNKSSPSEAWINGLFSKGIQFENEERYQVLVSIIQLKDAEELLIDSDNINENTC